MDRNAILGLVLIAAIIIGYTYLTKPSEEEIQRLKEEAQLRKDSIENVRQERIEKERQRRKAQQAEEFSEETVDADTLTKQAKDSLEMQELIAKYGNFAKHAEGDNEFISLENEKLKILFSSKGGRPYSVELKEYKKYDSTHVVLFDGDSTVFNMTLFANNNLINTQELYYTPNTDKTEIVLGSDSTASLAFRVYAGDDKYIEHKYTISPESYIVDFDLNFVGLQEIIPMSTNKIDFSWQIDVPRQEQGKDWENQNTTIYYKGLNDEVDYLSETSEMKQEEISAQLKWIALKQQFFSSVLIADTHIIDGKIEYKTLANSPNYLKHFKANLRLPYNPKQNTTIDMRLYFGPNKYKVLKNIGADENLHLQELIPLGWAIFRWVNRFAIIPLFNFLGSFISNYGLIIFIMTIIIKLVLFPLTYKSYLSTAKMRVLKPQIDEINKKIPKEKAMERQQATMSLYKRAGVNPMGGCLPMLLQMPILIAMFRFFPASIELRQESFLWANDLSTYDSILDLPFEIPWYGDHISLFCLLMAASMILTTKYNSTQMNTGGSQMPGMKMMMYFMPVLMLIWFNNYSSGLSYYYFITNIITFGQQRIIRSFVDDDEILKKIQAKKKKPVKKTKFQKRIEEMAKEKGYKPPKKKK